MALSVVLHIPSPPINGFYVGPLFVHFYGLMYVVGIALAVYITRRRWRAVGGDVSLVTDVATWAVPAGIIGGRIYFDITTPFDITPHAWYPCGRKAGEICTAQGRVLGLPNSSGLK